MILITPGAIPSVQFMYRSGIHVHVCAVFIWNICPVHNTCTCIFILYMYACKDYVVGCMGICRCSVVSKNL